MNSKYFLWKCDEADKPWFHSSWEYVEDFSLTMSGSGSIPRLLSSLSSFCLWNKERKIKKEKTPNYILWQLFWPNSEFSLRFWSPVAHLQGGLCNPVTCKPLSHLHCIFWEEPYHQTDVAEWSTTCMRASLTEEVLNHNPEMIWGRHHADVKKFNYPCNSIQEAWLQPSPVLTESRTAGERFLWWAGGNIHAFWASFMNLEQKLCFIGKYLHF